MHIWICYNTFQKHLHTYFISLNKWCSSFISVYIFSFIFLYTYIIYHVSNHITCVHPNSRKKYDWSVKCNSYSASSVVLILHRWLYGKLGTFAYVYFNLVQFLCILCHYNIGYMREKCFCTNRFSENSVQKCVWKKLFDFHMLGKKMFVFISAGKK